MKNVSTKSILGLLFLPRIIPRFRHLFGSGFGFLSLLMAQLYVMVRLLPPDHPYLNPQNVGTFGIHNVVAAAANNLVIKRQNIDQILVFAAIMLGVVLMISQVILLCYSLLINPAAAQLEPPANLFATPKPVSGDIKDIAFILMDKVFGIKDLFCVDNKAACTAVNATLPLPFHEALHKLLQFYSTGMLLIGVVIFLYYILVVVFETAATGSPFGQRFQNGWVPIRLVVALGLLIPINHGLNSAQYITLYAAKFGSGFATNGWLLFNRTMEADVKNPLGEKTTLLAKPTPPDLSPTIQAMSMVHACAYAYWHNDKDPTTRPRPSSDTFYIKPYLVKSPNSKLKDQATRKSLTPSVTYKEALEFFNNADIVIRFGQEAESNKAYTGNVEPLCGEVRIPITDISHIGEPDRGGAEAIQNFYFNLIKWLWYGGGADVTSIGSGDTDAIDQSSDVGDFILRMSQRYMAVVLRQEGKRIWDNDLQEWVVIPMECIIGCGNDQLPSCTKLTTPFTVGDCVRLTPSAEARQYIINLINDAFAELVKKAWVDYNKNGTRDFDMTDEILALGWGGAGSWYNKISQINGSFIGAVHAMPNVVKYPSVMEQVRKIRREEDQALRGFNHFEPVKSDGKSIGADQMGSDDLALAKGLYLYYKWWNEDDPNFARPDKQMTGRVFEDVINAVFGTHNLMAMRGANAHVHPMAQLTALGKGLVDSAIINVTGSAFTGFLAGISQKSTAGLMSMASSFLSSTAFIGLTAGGILYYILPFMPFLYFFFALGEWIKTIFEAMVGVPLWALAHIRLAGEGLPGPSGMNGYLLIFDIFLRPIMTVFGLVAAMIVFTGQVRLLHLIWDLVIDNLTGSSEMSDAAIYDMGYFTVQRGVVDHFFFTVVYAIIVWMLANTSFKLIDTIPDKVLRWMQGGVSTFGDMSQSQHIENIKQYAVMSGITFGQQGVEATTGLMRGTGGILGKAFRGAGEAG